LTDEAFLTDEFLRQLMSVGEVDLLVGICSHNNAKTIGLTVATIEDSFRRHFSRDRVVIVNVDVGSRDGTSEIVLNTEARRIPSPRGLTSLRTEHRVVTRDANAPSEGTAGKAFRTLLAAADLLRAKACAIVSPLTSNLSDAWVKSLVQPAYHDNFDFIAPLYSRHKYDGLLARNLLYPISRAIFGRGIRELHPSEFGFSGRLASHCLNQDVWHQEAIRAAPEIWMALTAVSSEFQCCQSFLGPKAHPATSSGTNIVAAVCQTVGTLFWCLESQQPYWMERTQPEPVRTFGPDHELTAEPVHINRKRIFELFQSGIADLSPILRSILAEDTHREIQRVAIQSDQKFRLENELWSRIICDFAASYHNDVLNRDHLIQALVPLYRGRIYSFLVKHEDSSLIEIEVDTENLCLEFERQKPYLIERWRG
jgi:glucosylglycerate synthase